MLTLAILNHLIQQNRELQLQWQQQAGRVLCWILPMVNLHGRINEQGFWQADEAEAEATITIPMQTITKMMSGQPVGVGDVQLQGDRQLAMTVLPLLQALQYDWRDDLARLLGDSIGGSLALQLDKFKQSGQESYNNITEQLVDYLHENHTAVLGKAQFRRFSQDLAQLRDDEARLAQRLNRLQHYLQTKS